MRATRDGLFLTQHKCIRDILAQTSMDGAKDVKTPFMSTSISLTLVDSSSLVDSMEYHRVIGALQLTLARLDISCAVNKLSQFMYCPTTTHWIETKIFLRYLKNTFFLGITIGKTHTPTLTCFSGTDWASNLDDRSSTFAYLILLGTIPI